MVLKKFCFKSYFFIQTLSTNKLYSPCALGLAAPTAVMVGSGLAAHYGVLIKGGEVLEISHKLNAIVFDKTGTKLLSQHFFFELLFLFPCLGTLTYGKPSVTDTILVNKEISELEFYRLVGSAESGSEHPLGQAIVDFAKQLPNISMSQPQNFQGNDRV